MTGVTARPFDIFFEIHNNSGKRYRLLTHNCYFLAQTIVVRKSVAFSAKFNDVKYGIETQHDLEAIQGGDSSPYPTPLDCPSAEAGGQGWGADASYCPDAEAGRKGWGVAVLGAKER